MSSLLVGVLAGLYAGNPSFRRTVDATIKKAVSHGIDALNSGTGAKLPPVGDSSDTQDDE